MAQQRKNTAAKSQKKKAAAPKIKSAPRERRVKAGKIYELILKDGSHHFTNKKSFDSFKLRSTEIVSFEAHNGSFVGEMFVLKENIHCFVVYDEQTDDRHDKKVSFVKHKR